MGYKKRFKPSEVTDGLEKYFWGRGMQNEAEFMKNIKHLATV